MTKEDKRRNRVRKIRSTEKKWPEGRSKVKKMGGGGKLAEKAVTKRREGQKQN